MRKIFIADYSKKVLREKATMDSPRNLKKDLHVIEQMKYIRKFFQHTSNLKEYNATWITSEMDGKEFVEGKDFEVKECCTPGKSFEEKWFNVAVQISESDAQIEMVVAKIFYSPASNGKAEESIKAGIEEVKRLIKAYTATQTLSIDAEEMVKLKYPDGEFGCLVKREAFKAGYAASRTAMEREMYEEDIEDIRMRKELAVDLEMTKILEDIISASPQSSTSEEENLQDWRDVIDDINDGWMILELKEKYKIYKK